MLNVHKLNWLLLRRKSAESHFLRQNSNDAAISFMLIRQWRKRLNRRYYMWAVLMAVATLLATSGVRVEAQQFGKDASDWHSSSAPNCTFTLGNVATGGLSAVKIDYALSSDGWVDNTVSVPDGYSTTLPIVFSIKAADTTSNLEIKLNAKDGTVFGRKISLEGKYADWTEITIYERSLEYWWGGDGKFDAPSSFSIALSGGGSGTVWISDMHVGLASAAPTFAPAGPVLDISGDQAGIGFSHRRSESLTPENPLVLKYLMLMQDTSSPDKKLMPAEEDVDAQLFNNSLVSIVFTLKGQKARSERILDFFNSAMRKDNADLTLQNFYYHGEARGFYQTVSLANTADTPEYHEFPTLCDRWMGDMCWLMIASTYFDRKYHTQRYAALADSLHSLMVSWFKDAGPDSGFVQSGWRHGDTSLHEKSGHPEGNIDAYAAFMVVGDTGHAEMIHKWLDQVIGDRNNLPIDLYSWRVLAFGKPYANSLKTPEDDLRFRKTVMFNGHHVVGFYSRPDIDVNNIWCDALGHMACDYFVVGQPERAAFYSNQMDLLLIPRDIGGVHTMAMPYATNATGDYKWVDTSKGFTSTCAWYILAKNRFDPYTLRSY